MSVFTQDGWSALMHAASEGRTEVVVELVKAGANLNLQNAVCQLYTHCLFLVLHVTTGIVCLCTELMCLDRVGCISIPPQRGDSAVIRATLRYQSGALQELVRAGADLNLQNEVRCRCSYCRHCTAPCIIPSCP